jgi:hypothetical protein
MLTKYSSVHSFSTVIEFWFRRARPNPRNGRGTEKQLWRQKKRKSLEIQLMSSLTITSTAARKKKVVKNKKVDTEVRQRQKK